MSVRVDDFQVLAPRPPQEDDEDDGSINLNTYFDATIDGQLGSAGVICAKSGAGKTVFTKFLYRCNKNIHFDDVMLFCNSSAIDTDYRWIDSRARRAFEPEVLEKVMAYQKQRKQQGNKRRLLIIFDDCIGSIKMTGKHKDLFERLVTQGRHDGIFSLFVIQSYKAGANPVIRQNSMSFTAIGSFSEDTCKEFQAVSGAFDSVSECKQVIKQVCKDHQFFVYQDRSKQPMRIVKVPPQYV